MLFPPAIKEVRDIMKMWGVESSAAVLQFSNRVIMIKKKKKHEKRVVKF